MKDEENLMTRRSLIDWLGKTAVLALGSELISACAAAEHFSDEADGGAGASCSFPFEPGKAEAKVFKSWGERTVDEQNLSAILKSWRLKVDGMVEKPFELTFGQLIDLKRLDLVMDFHCVEGWSILDVPWNGTHLSTLFDIAKPLKGATHVTFHTVGDKYNESLPIGEALEPHTLLAYGIGCKTLPLKHGFPARLVIPRKYAYKSPKYVYRVELTDRAVEGFWVANGYPYEGDVPKSKLRDGKY